MSELDHQYFAKKLQIVLRDVQQYTAEEMALELYRLASTANPTTQSARINEPGVQLSASQAREAELREKLKVVTNLHAIEQDMRIAEEKLRRAAEASIKASQEQEPVAYVTDWEGSRRLSFHHPKIGAVTTPLYKQPPIPPELAELQRENAELKQLINDACAVYGIGSEAQTRSVLITNMENARRRSECLGAIERECFTIEVPDEEFGGMTDECLLNWWQDPEQYVATFKAELRKLLEESKVPEGSARAYLQDLVAALDSSFISSWQTTAGWQKQLDAARDYLAAAPQPKEAEVRVKLCASCGFHQNCPTRDDDGGLCDDYVAQPKEPKQ